MNPYTRKRQTGKKTFFGFILNSRKLWQVGMKWIILLAIAYGNLLLSGLIFDKLLKWYSGSVVILIWVGSVALAAIACGVLMTVRFIKYKIKTRAQRYKD